MLDNRIIVKNTEDQSIPVKNDSPIYIYGTYSMRYAAGQQTLRLSGTIQACTDDNIVCDPFTGAISAAAQSEFDAEAYGKENAYKDYPYFYWEDGWYYALSRYSVGTGYSRITAKKCIAVQ